MAAALSTQSAAAAPPSLRLTVGVDVGGTNTDAVLIESATRSLVAASKRITTRDPAEGIAACVSEALSALRSGLQGRREVGVDYVAVGTTHFLNAVLERSPKLARVALMRVCGPCTHSLPAFCELPPDLRALVDGYSCMLHGGYEFDGAESEPVDAGEVARHARAAAARGCREFAVVGVFAPLKREQEEKVRALIVDAVPDARVTLSHEIGGLGLLERENATVLNASLRPLAEHTIEGLGRSLEQAGLRCPFFLSQNDGTLLPSERAKKFPVLCFASGQTNSMRGAAFLTGLKNAVVIDVGGTSADAGLLVGGFPRFSEHDAVVGGLRMQFRMPHVVSIALGGGSVVRAARGAPYAAATVGPDSVGYAILEKALCFGGDTLTATDVAVALRGVEVLTQASVMHKEPRPVDCAKAAPAGVADARAWLAAVQEQMDGALENLLDRVTLSAEPLPVVFVGGGAILVSRGLRGCSSAVVPRFFDVANAVGAAISQVSGVSDAVYAMTDATRAELMAQARARAIEACCANGARPATVEVVEVTETPAVYMPGSVRVTVKAVGSIAVDAPPPPSAATGPAKGAALVLQPRPGGASRARVAAIIAATAGKQVAATGDVPVSVAGLPCEPEAQSIAKSKPGGVWLLSADDVRAISIGCGVLGSGGGGTTAASELQLLALLEQGARVSVVPVESLGASDMAFPVAFMGAPTVLLERLPRGDEMKLAVLAMQHHAGCKAAALMSPEIGGTNGLNPLIAAAQLGVAVADCDLMGRAFPEVQMITTAIAGEPLTPASLSDDKGNTVVVARAVTGGLLEKLLRSCVVAMGCIASLAIAPMSGEALAKHAVRCSLSRAHRLGLAVREARAAKRDPVAALIQSGHGRLLTRGRVVDVRSGVEGGFNRGQAWVASDEDDEGAEKKDAATRAPAAVCVHYQNENVMALAYHSADAPPQPIACTPDIISVLHSDTADPIPAESVRFGMRVAVVALSAPAALTTDAALRVVGPACFGFKGFVYRRAA